MPSSLLLLVQRGQEGSSRPLGSEGKRDCQAPMRELEMGFSTHTPGSRQALTKGVCQTKRPLPPLRSSATPAAAAWAGRAAARSRWAAGRAGCVRGWAGLGWERGRPCPWPTLLTRGAPSVLWRHRGIQLPGRVPEGKVVAGSHRLAAARARSCESDRASLLEARVSVAVCGKGASLELKARLLLSAAPEENRSSRGSLGSGPPPPSR